MDVRLILFGGFEQIVLFALPTSLCPEIIRARERSTGRTS